MKHINKTKSAQVLPIYDEKSPIKGIQYFAPCILFGDEKYYPWLFSNYIQLEWKEHDCIRFSIFDDNYEGISVLDTQVIYREILLQCDIDIIQMVISNIDAGYYTQLCLNEFYVPNKKAYRKFSYIHDELVFGYDISKGLFNILGYDSNDRLRKSDVDFEDFRKAFYEFGNSNSLGVGSMNYAKKIFILKGQENPKYIVNFHTIKHALMSYLEGEDYLINYDMIFNDHKSKISGIRIYEKFINGIEDRSSEIVEDIRLSHVIYEHKYLMRLRIEYLSRYCGYSAISTLVDLAKEVEELALCTRNLHLKYLLTRDMKYMDRVKKFLLKLIDGDRCLLTGLIEKI